MYSPITFPSGSFAGTFVAGCPFSSNNVYVAGSIGTVFWTATFTSGILISGTVVLSTTLSINVTGCFWTWPWTSCDVAGCAFGLAPITIGRYLPIAGCPSLSTRCTITPLASPTNVFSGTKSTVPSGWSV